MIDECEEQPEDENITEINSPNEIPEFADQEEEATFWDSHELSAEFFARFGPAPAHLLPPVRSGESARPPAR